MHNNFTSGEKIVHWYSVGNITVLENMKAGAFQSKCRNHSGDGYLCKTFCVDIQKQCSLRVHSHKPKKFLQVTPSQLMEEGHDTQTILSLSHIRYLLVYED